MFLHSNAALPSCLIPTYHSIQLMHKSFALDRLHTEDGKKRKCSHHQSKRLYILMVAEDKLMFLWSGPTQYNGTNYLQDF